MTLLQKHGVTFQKGGDTKGGKIERQISTEEYIANGWNVVTDKQLRDNDQEESNPIEAREPDQSGAKSPSF